jgi:hypothetical protein
VIRPASLVLLLALGACRGERKLTEADCALVKDKLEKAWQRDALAAQRLADTEVFRGFIREEGDRIVEAFEEECSRMVGRTVRAAELDCMQRADTIDDVYECAK